MDKRFCTHCGKEVNPEAVVCVNCGCSVASNSCSVNGSAGISDGMKTAIKVFMILGVISGALCGLIPLIWCIPMNSKVNRYLDGKEKLSVGFKVCVLLFVNVVAGVLLLIQDDNSTNI